MLEQFPIWLVVGFVAQFLWVAGILIDKTLLEKYLSDSEEVDSANSLLFISGVFSVIIAIGVGLLNFSEITLDKATVYGLTAVILNGLWIYLYLKALDETEASKAVPIFQTIPVFGIVFGAFFLNEYLDFSQVLAILIIVFGAFVLSFNLNERKLELKPILLMLIASGSVALQETVFKMTADASVYWNAIFWMTLGMPLFVLLLAIVQPKSYASVRMILNAKFKKVWIASTFNEVIDNSANFAFVFAITLAPIAIVQSVNAFQPIILLVAATVLAKYTNNTIKEDLAITSLAQKFIAIIAITIGSLILYSSIL